MAEFATIARPYAEALFEACRNELGPTQDWLKPLAQLAGDKELQGFATNPKVTPAQVFELLASAGGKPLPERGANFLRTIVQNNRLAALPEVARQFGLLVDAAEDVTAAVVYTPFALSDADLQGLKPSLEKRFGRRLELTQQTDPSLIGGIRVVAGDEVLDTSVKARLEQMKAALAA